MFETRYENITELKYRVPKEPKPLRINDDININPCPQKLPTFMQ